MRIRKKKWAKPELDVCEYHINKPETYKGKWNGAFENNASLHLELGCGRGTFISKLAKRNPHINYIAIDLKTDMLGYAKRNIDKEYGETEPKNVYIFEYNIEQILNVFNREDKIERIYINFCNPWPKAKHKKRRLTHINQLEKYKQIGIDNFEIYFKTDDDGLFEESLTYFKDAGFKIVQITRDLHEEDIFDGNIATEHENMFSEQGIRIKALIARGSKD